MNASEPPSPPPPPPHDECDPHLPLSTTVGKLALVSAYASTLAVLCTSAKMLFHRARVAHPVFAAAFQELAVLCGCGWISFVLLLVMIGAEEEGEGHGQWTTIVPYMLISAFAIQFHQTTWLCITVLRYVKMLFFNLCYVPMRLLVLFQTRKCDISVDGCLIIMIYRATKSQRMCHFSRPPCRYKVYSLPAGTTYSYASSCKRTSTWVPCARMHCSLSGQRASPSRRCATRRGWPSPRARDDWRRIRRS